MKKLKWIGSALLLLGIIVFASCSLQNSKKIVISESSPSQPKNSQSSVTNMPYGSYLAGRVAHLRRDFNNASDYYIKALKIDPDNKKLISQVYLLLVSKSRIDEAASYADQYIQNGSNDNFAHTVIAVWNMHHNQYQKSIDTTSKYNNPAYKSFIAPLLNAWNYVGLNSPQKALDALKPLEKEPGFKGIYLFHSGMIHDYFDNTAQAQKYYERLLNEESSETSLRSLQIISNFYLRNKQAQKAFALVNGINNDRIISEILGQYAKQNQAEAVIPPQKIITTPQEGSAEALFSVAATFRYDSIIDVAHMFISLAIYQNPDYDLAKLLLADILENRGMLDDANDIYQTIKQGSPVYYTAQLKTANNFIKQSDYKSAELLLKSLVLDFENAQLYIEIGDVLRLKGSYLEAIKYYQKALKKSSGSGNKWVIYYALGVSYEQSGNWPKAEEALLKAKELSNDNYMVLNYLGYSWFSQKKNITEAFVLITKAYNQAPNDVNITDSLGWALYNLGYYGMSSKYLEEAAENAPENPVIRDHLGDIYWFTNRQNEARFQWQQALDLKDKSGEINRKNIENKIKNGITQTTKIEFDKDIVSQAIASLSQNK